MYICTYDCWRRSCKKVPLYQDIMGEKKKIFIWPKVPAQKCLQAFGL